MKDTSSWLSIYCCSHPYRNCSLLDWVRFIYVSSLSSGSKLTFQYLHPEVHTIESLKQLRLMFKLIPHLILLWVLPAAIVSAYHAFLLQVAASALDVSHRFWWDWEGPRCPSQQRTTGLHTSVWVCERVEMREWECVYMGSRGRVGRSATVISLDIRSSLGFRIRFRFRVGIRCRIPHDTHGSVTSIYTLTGDTFSDKGDFMSRSRSLYCHSDTGPTGPTALILREQIRSSLSRTVYPGPFIRDYLVDI